MILAFHLAKNSLKKHRLRTFLAMLGVMVGVFLISLVLLITAGLQKSLEKQIAGLDSDILLIKNQVTNRGGIEAFSELQMSPIFNLTLRDFVTVKEVKSVEFAAPEMFLSGEIKSGKNNYNGISIVATNENFAKIFNLKMKSGAWFASNEMDKNWVVLGNKLASGLLGNQDAAGQIVRLKNQEFLVVGVIDSVQEPISLSGTDIDKTAFISINQGLNLSQNIDSIGQVVAKVPNKNSRENAKNQITEKLAEIRGGSQDFAIFTGENTSENIASWIKIMTRGAIIFAIISLIVGGIGIMNIMLVSIVERRREIGIRKAVGAKNRQILLQFLVEAILISLTGGIVGIFSAYCVGFLIALWFSLPIVFNLEIFAIGLGFPLLAGIFFGFFPSFKAAKSDPIVALRDL